MTSAQIYCTLDELIGDLSLHGDEPGLYSRIQTASQFIRRRFGNFIPIVETRYFQGAGRDLPIDPLLSVTQILNNGNVVSDYQLHPLNRLWENGPYVRVYAESTNWDDEDIQITGAWGKWTGEVSLGVNVTQLVGDTTLVVSDGSILSIGAVVHVESEQELVTDLGAATVLTSLLNGAVDAADETITIDNGAEVHEGEVIQISTEQMRVRIKAGHVLRVDRGWNLTTRQSHADDAPISVYRTFAVTRGVNGTTAAAHSNKALSRYTPPDDVNWLCRQIAGLMHMKAKSNFAGKTGSAETGETFYFNEFPSQLKEIARNYRIVLL